MKNILIFLSILIFANAISFSQNRGVIRGAEPAELYLSTHGHSIYYVQYGYGDSCRYKSVCRVTENGKKLAIQYNIDIIAEQYNPPDSIMYPYAILADATSGVIYAKTYYVKSGYSHTSLWVSFDYGKNWIHREENKGQDHFFLPILKDTYIEEKRWGEFLKVLIMDNLSNKNTVQVIAMIARWVGANKNFLA